MNQKLIILLPLTISLLLTSCGGKKLSETSGEDNNVFAQVYSPIDLYFMCPTAMSVNPGNEQNPMAYLPDFVTYSNDLVKFGLKGNVKECVKAVSTFSWTYKFNILGNLTNYQFRMDSQGRYGNGVRLEYNSDNQLTLLGRDFRGQSPNSDSYTYTDGHLTLRQNGSRYREYVWKKADNGKLIPVKSITHELKPLLDIEYAEDASGIVRISKIIYNNPNLPIAITAKQGESTFEYDENGRIVKVNTHYTGCSTTKYREMRSESVYSYNDKGNVDKEIITLYDSDTENKVQIYTVTQSYEYIYDEQDNWISVTMSSSDPQPGTIPVMNRRISYYSDEEIIKDSQSAGDANEKVFVGEWEYKKTYQHNVDGETEMVIDEGKIVLSLYDKFTPEWSTEPILGAIYSQTVPSLGMEQSGSFIIIQADINGTQANIKIEGYYSKDVYSATIQYDVEGRSLLLDNLKLVKRGEHNADEAGDETFDLEPFEGIYFLTQQ